MTLRKMLLACAVFLLLLSFAEIGGLARQQPAASGPLVLAPGDAEFRADIRTVEGLLPTISDRGAAQFFLAWLHAHLGEFQKSLALLSQCPLDEGFDPGGVEPFHALESNAEFRAVVARVHRRYPPVHQARVAFTIQQTDLFPEGIVADLGKPGFYMGSMYYKKIVHITQTGEVSDFVKPGLYNLGPVGGVHLDPSDHSVWAAADPLGDHPSELLHFDSDGKLLERFSAPGPGPHDLNDLVLRDSREIYVTDTYANQVYRFDRKAHTFSAVAFPRPIFYPNGITLSDDGNFLYAADMLGVIRVDLRNSQAQDVIVGQHYTLAGIDGLYWYHGGLVGVQYGAGAYRIMQWHLSADGLHVTSAKFLEYRTVLVKDPTTGAIVGDNFYFMANTGIDNLDDDGRIVDRAKLETLHIAVVPLK
jgi:hypothetical protein